MLYDLTILIPTFQRNSDLHQALTDINSAQLTLNIKLCVLILDNDPQNTFDVARYQNVDILYDNNERNIGGRGSFAKLLETYHSKKLSQYAIFLTDDDRFISADTIKYIHETMSNNSNKLVFQFNGQQHREGKSLSFVYSPLIHLFGISSALDSFRVMSGCGLNRDAIPNFLLLRNEAVAFREFAYPMQFLAMSNLPNYCFIQKKVFWHKIDNATFWDYTNHRNSFWLNRIEVFSKLKKYLKSRDRKVIEIVYKRFVSRNIYDYGLSKEEHQLVLPEDRPFLESNIFQNFYSLQQRTENILIKLFNFFCALSSK